MYTYFLLVFAMKYSFQEVEEWLFLLILLTHSFLVC